MKKLLLVCIILLFQSYTVLFGQTEEATGNLKGTVTWQYNSYVGTKPDVGASIYLIKESQEDISKFKVIANGYGNYEINDVPVGNYFVVIISYKTTSDPKTWHTKISGNISSVLSADNLSRLDTYISLHKYYVVEIKIKENKTVDVSYDFGNTYL